MRRTVTDMRRSVVGTVVAALLLLSCGDRSPGTTETVSDTTTSAPPAPAATTKTRAKLPAPTTTAGGATQWPVCTNAERGYSIRHPAGWHTAYGCRYLDPAPLDIPPATDGFFSAVAVVAGDTSFEQARRRADDRFLVILLRKETTIAGRSAVRYETEATGEGLLDKGSRLYSVVIDNAGRSFEILTAWFPGTSTSEYELRKELVDEMVATVRFL